MLLHQALRLETLLVHSSLHIWMFMNMEQRMLKMHTEPEHCFERE